MSVRAVPRTSEPAVPVGATLLLAVGELSATERKLVAAWRLREHPDARSIAATDPGLPAALGVDDGTLVVPVVVTWLPPQHDGTTSNLGTVVELLSPRRPWGPMQPIVARDKRGRAQVTPGEPATVGALRARFSEQEGTGDAEAFAAFVCRQALLACDRAERGLLGDRYKVPRLVAEQIAASARFRERIELLAKDDPRPVEELLAEGESCLRELATVQSPLGIDAYRRFMKPMHANAWTVEIDRAGLEPLRELNKQTALVFLPTHRSYVDPLVLQEALHLADLPRNHVLGGDNMSWWPLGAIGKRAGIVWIRRNFGSDRVYKLAVREFLGHLVAKRFNLEWYIEGGRTRTGKLRPPKLGLLRYLVEAISDDRAEDVTLVPVSIVYDRLREVGAMTSEQTGGKKQSEGLRWWVEYVQSQRQNVGKARVHFGVPFSLRDALASVEDPTLALEKVAFRICDGINEVTPVTPTSLISFALLGSRDVALSLQQIRGLTEPLLDYCAAGGVPGPIAELHTEAGLRVGLDSLVEAGVAECYDGGTEPVWRIASDRHHVAAFYRNSALHHLVGRAIVELALVEVQRRRRTEDVDVLEAAWGAALRLRDLLKFEFFFAEKPRFREQLIEELALVAPDWRERAAESGGGGVGSMLAELRPPVAHRTLRCFFDAQLVVAQLLAARDPRQAYDRKALIAECQAVGTQMLLQGELHGAEAVGRELFASAIDLAANRDLVDPGREEVRVARQAWLTEVRAVLGDLHVLGELDRVMLEEVLHGNAR